MNSPIDLNIKKNVLDCFDKFWHSDTTILLWFYAKIHISVDLRLLLEQKQVESDVIECLNRLKAVRNELYARLDLIEKVLDGFDTMSAHILLGFCTNIHMVLDFRLLLEPKYVESDMIECLNRLKSVRNDLYARFNPKRERFGLFWHVFGILTAIFCTDFTLIYIYW